MPWNKEKRRQRDIKRRARRLSRGLCLACGKHPPLPLKTVCEECSWRQAMRWWDLRAEVWEAYGGAVCACCGEDNPDFLSLDHIDGNGAEDRRRRGSEGMGLYSKLRKEAYPPGYQVLCHNCNKAKGVGRECTCQLWRGHRAARGVK